MQYPFLIDNQILKKKAKSREEGDSGENSNPLALENSSNISIWKTRVGQERPIEQIKEKGITQDK